MKRTAILLLAGILGAGSASGIEGVTAQEAVVRHSAHMQERTTPEECGKRYRSFMERNTLRLSERRERRKQCLAASAARETVVAGEQARGVPAPSE
jgi:hypothetical protein